MDAPVLLASSSPRRRQLLAALGVAFEVVEPDVAELGAGEPAQLVVENALRKARAAFTARPDGVVIGADTEVVIDGEILGKPADEAAARQMLAALRGREHEVHGGVAICETAGERTAHELTRVCFGEYDPKLIEAYVRAGAWQGFAGGYAIQAAGSLLVESVEGELANVIGMPMRALLRLLPDLVSG